MNPCNDMTVLPGSSAGSDLANSPPNPGHPIRVWLVDDNRAFRGVLAEILAEVSGFDCSREFSSADAVLSALAAEAPPDVILLDNQMPGLYGAEAVRPIKWLAASTRVIMLTTCFDGLLQQRVLRDGAADFLQKSASVETIAQRIRVALAKPAAAVRDSVLAEKNRGDRFSQPAACGSSRQRNRREAWASASGRLLSGAFRVRSWLAMFF